MNDNIITLVIDGQLPNLNDYTKACRTHRLAGAEMKKKAEANISAHIKKCLNGANLKGTIELSFRWYEPNKKRDLDNICFAKKFILDALVKNEVIKGDGWNCVVGFVDKFYVDKDYPRIEVDIKEIQNA